MMRTKKITYGSLQTNDGNKKCFTTNQLGGLTAKCFMLRIWWPNYCNICSTTIHNSKIWYTWI